MLTLWMLIFGFVIFWALEIRFNQLSCRIEILENVIKDFSDHIAKLRQELEDKRIIKGYDMDRHGHLSPKE